jgi:hypothetical protein
MTALDLFDSLIVGIPTVSPSAKWWSRRLTGTGPRARLRNECHRSPSKRASTPDCRATSVLSRLVLLLPIVPSRRAIALLAAQGRYDTSQTKLLCFSAAGFKDSLRREAAADSDLILVAADELYGG